MYKLHAPQVFVFIRFIDSDMNLQALKEKAPDFSEAFLVALTGQFSNHFQDDLERLSELESTNSILLD
jgi:hypothetical protein